MKRLLLKNKNLYTTVDDEDFDELNKYTWFAMWDKSSKSFYAASTFKDNNGKPHHQLLHRFILKVTNPNILVDHENRDTLCNTKDNLRKSTQTENQQNSIARKGTSKYKGVCKTSDNKRWRSQIRANGKKLHLGETHSEIEAAILYDIAARKYHGKFARLNFPDQSFLPLASVGMVEGVNESDAPMF